MEFQKRTYQSPKIECSSIELEMGIARSSAYLVPGDSDNPSTPKVEDWRETMQDNDFDVI